ncbi:MAG: site-2 protease family protein [Pyrinomonadaceae bacterium]|nr:site-2 protease family protein [Pyrinomonadaceae bacterium]
MRILEYLRRQFLITHVYGIPVRIDYRWFLVIAILTWLSANSIPDSLVENYLAKLGFGLTAILVFFFTVFLHELAHARIARKEGIQVIEILLHPFGGLAKLRKEPPPPRAEFRIAVAGPIASFLISLFFLGLFAISASVGTRILTPLFFILFLLNLMLAIFNLFPGYPLDGGRVLRAFLWHRGTDLNEATIITGRFGQVIAVVLLIFGIAISLINRDVLSGLWTILVGVFLFDAARGIIRQASSFKNLVVENVMEIPVPVPPGMTVMKFVDNVLPLYKRVVFPVSTDGQLFGFVLLADLKSKIPKEKWHETEIKDVMRNINENYFVQLGSSVVEARALMSANGIGAVGVIDSKGDLVGFIQNRRIRVRH